ncbi:hypothetical protein D7X33_12945, partial [Butyricicoccus sp. 1XD8-22]
MPAAAPRGRRIPLARSGKICYNQKHQKEDVGGAAAGAGTDRLHRSPPRPRPRNGPNRREGAFMKKLLCAAAVLCTLLLLFAASSCYASFATEQIYRESASHLNEIYTQINNAFRSTISKNYRLLHGWR